MRQVKLFKHVEAEIADMQSQVNTWLKEAQQDGATIINISGNIAPQTVGNSTGGANRFSPSDLFVIIEYETNQD